MRKILLTFFLCVVAFLAHAQTKSLSIGVKIINDFEFGGLTIHPGLGGQLVYRITKHSGLETGLYYSNQTVFYYTYVSSSGSFSGKISEHWLILPLLYRFDSKIINFTAGTQIEYFLGWKHKSDDSRVQVTSYSRSSARLAASTAVSKTIKLSEKLLLEPETRMIVYPSDGHATLGLNISLRKKLF